MKTRALIAGIMIIFLASCHNKIPFTYDVKTKLELNDLDVRRVQFYNSEKIVLRRILPINEAKVNHGEVRIENGKLVDEIIINEETPGICREYGEYDLDVSFEPGNRKTINFRLNKMTKTFDIYVEQQSNNAGEIVYDSLIYFLEPSKKRPLLLIRKDDKYIYQLNQRILKGQLVR